MVFLQCIDLFLGKKWENNQLKKEIEIPGWIVYSNIEKRLRLRLLFFNFFFFFEFFWWRLISCWVLRKKNWGGNLSGNFCCKRFFLIFFLIQLPISVPKQIYIYIYINKKVLFCYILNSTIHSERGWLVAFHLIKGMVQFYLHWR